MNARGAIIAVIVVAAVFVGLWLLSRAHTEPVRLVPTPVVSPPAADPVRPSRARVEEVSTPAAPPSPVAESTVPAVKQANPRVRVSCRARAIEGCRFAVAGHPTSFLAAVSPEPGLYELTPPEGSSAPLRVEVQAAGFRPVVATLVSSDIVEVALAAGARVEGRVIGPVGLSIARCAVYFAGRVALTDDAGSFRFDDLASGRYSGFRIDFHGLLREVPRELDLRDAAEVVQVELRIAEESKFAVQVVSATDGAPVAAAKVRFSATDNATPDQVEVETNERGEAWIAGLPTGEYWCRVTGERIDTIYVERVRIPPPQPLVVRAAPVQFHRVFGRVVDPKGRPIAGVRVGWSGMYEKGKRPPQTGADGRFSLDAIRDVPRGGGAAPTLPRRRLGLWAPGWLTAEYVVEWDRELQLTLAPQVTWTARVQGEPGEQLPGFDFVFRTSDGGEFVGNFPAVDSRDSRSITWRDAPGLSGVLEVRFATGAVVQMDVDATRSNPVVLGTILLPVGGSLRLQNPTIGETDHPYVSWCRPGTTTPLGGAVLERHGAEFRTPYVVPPGTWQLVYVGGHLLADDGVCDVVERAVTDFVMRPRRLSELTVVVMRGSEPVRDATVQVALPDASEAAMSLREVSLSAGVARYAGAGMALRTTTDALGRAWFTRLPPGRVRVAVETPGGVSREVETILSEGSPATAPIELDESRR